jgi:dTDP-4-dehydrorhamnose 3,5-epimerase
VVFQETKLKGAFIIDIEKREDERGFFARSWCPEEFRAHGLNTALTQVNISQNTRRGTLRGMHYQVDPAPETKVVRCARGRLYDVIVDLRPGSPTYLQWIGVELSAASYRMLYVPELFAHGFLTLEDDTEVHYLMSGAYSPSCARGARYNDPAFSIRWPEEVRVISERDADYPDFQPESAAVLSARS